MEKLLIHLYVPALMQDYDLFVPQDVPIARVILVLTDGVAQQSQGKYCPSQRECLIPAGADAPLRPDKTLADYGIQDGEMLLLI